MLTVKVCHGHACKSSLSPYIVDRVRSECNIPEDKNTGKLPKSGKPVKVEETPCQGKCKQAVNVTIEGSGAPQHINRCDPIKVGTLLADR